MTHFVKVIMQEYHDLVETKSDPRINDWPLMSSPLPTLLICSAYAYFVKILGPRLMKNRKPFDLKYTLIIYNLYQVMFSTYLFTEGVRAMWTTNYNFKCELVDPSRSSMAMRIVRGCWLYYFSKFVDCLDSVFFVLRKKNNNISNLHVIHHGLVPVFSWIGVKFVPGGNTIFCGIVNNFVHIFMYAYYLIAALGPHYQKFLWWKKYVTTIQMMQFIVVMIHSLQLLISDCNYPKFFAWMIGFESVLFYVLFYNFYKKTYGKKSTKVKIEVQEDDSKMTEANESSRRVLREKDNAQYSKMTLTNRILVNNFRG